MVWDGLCSNKDLLFKSLCDKSDYVYQELYNLNKRKLLKINKDEFLKNEDINLIKKLKYIFLNKII